MCEQEFSKIITEPCEVFCPQCGGISEQIEENNDPKQFKVSTPQDANATSSVNPQSQPNIPNNSNSSTQGSIQSQQTPARGTISIISNIREGPFGRIVVQTVVPRISTDSDAQNAPLQNFGFNPFGALMNPLLSGLMFGGSPMGDIESRLIEEFLRNDPNRHGAPPASQEAVNKLKETKYCEGACQTKECTVCQEDYKDEESLLHLPCNHNFHKACVTEWLLRHNTCPICRKGLQEEQESVQTSDL